MTVMDLIAGADWLTAPKSEEPDRRWRSWQDPSQEDRSESGAPARLLENQGGSSSSLSAARLGPTVAGEQGVCVLQSDESGHDKNMRTRNFYSREEVAEMQALHEAELKRLYRRAELAEETGRLLREALEVSLAIREREWGGWESTG